MSEPRSEIEPPVCVPLCGASKAYGSRVQWWHHEPQCPAREAEKAAESGSRGGSDE